MNWRDKAIVVGVKKFGEKSLIVNLFTPENGVYSGIIKSAQSKTIRGNYQLGNIVFATWKARLSEHLGFFTSELLESPASFFLNDNARLSCLISACSLLEKAMHEREKQIEIFEALKTLIDSLRTESYWLQNYVRLEMAVLKHQGFGLDLERCAATDSAENLIYVSPKSGRAVSESAGEIYKEKLLKLPEYLKNPQKNTSNMREIIDGLKLTGYFLEKFLLAPNGRKLPQMRSRFVESLQTRVEV